MIYGGAQPVHSLHPATAHPLLHLTWRLPAWVSGLAFHRYFMGLQPRGDTCSRKKPQKSRPLVALCHRALLTFSRQYVIDNRSIEATIIVLKSPLRLTPTTFQASFKRAGIGSVAVLAVLALGRSRSW